MKSKVTGALAAGITIAILATPAASASARTHGGESVYGIIVTSWGW
jgi:hypothetical protein